LASIVGYRFTLKIIDASASVPNNIILLRDDVFVSEFVTLSPAELLTSIDRFGIHVLLFENESERLIAATHVAPAEQILFMHYAGFDARELSASLLSRFSVIAKEYRNLNLISLLLSAAAHFYLGGGRRKVIAYLKESRHLKQKRILLTPAKDGIARQEYLNSEQILTLKPYFILFESLLNLDIKSSKQFEDLVYEIRCFDWHNQDIASSLSLNLQNQNIGLDRK
jgi:hypothetical protein